MPSHQPTGKKLIVRIISSKIFLIFGLFILGFIIIALGRETYRKYQVQKEINALQTEIENLEKSNQELAALLEYVKTESFKEKEAREKLNLQKSGEKVVIIPSQELNQQQSADIEKAAENINISNPIKWWQYLFASR